MAVKVYASPTCPWCMRLKEWLESKGIEHEAFDVSDPEAARELVEKSGQMGVPVTDVDGEIIVGFDEEALSKLLER